MELRIMTCQGVLPTNVQLEFRKHCDIHEYGTRNKNNLYEKAVTTRLRRDIANISGTRLLNYLPNVIRNSLTNNVFKRKLKTVSLFN